MDSHKLYRYDELEELLEKGLAPFGITPENIQDNWNRVRIIRHSCQIDSCGVIIDVLVDDQYAFSIRQEVKHVEVSPGITKLMRRYEMFMKGE